MSRTVLFFAPAVLLGLVACRSEPARNAHSVPSDGPKTAVIEKLLAKPKTVLPAGTAFKVRLDQALDTDRNRPGDSFTATLDEPVLVGDKVALPKGTVFTGHVTGAQPSGRLKGRGYLALTLDSFALNGEAHAIVTSTASRSTGSHKKRNVALIGGGSGAGAVIGGVAGGGKGAAIGAAAGAAAGTAGAAATGQKDVRLPAETVLRFTLKEPVQLTGRA